MDRSKAILGSILIITIGLAAFFLLNSGKPLDFRPAENRSIIVFKDNHPETIFNQPSWEEKILSSFQVKVHKFDSLSLPIKKEEIVAQISAKKPGMCIIGVSAGFTKDSYSLGEIKEYIDEIIVTCNQQKLQTGIFLDPNAVVPDNLKLVLQGSAKKHQATILDEIKF